MRRRINPWTYEKEYHDAVVGDAGGCEWWLDGRAPSITGDDEPADVEEYRREFPEFPQQSTGD
ncbi:MAG TPA: hypothetical protein VF988_14230, partial [Verrucomicrobiae bacterium]